MIIYIAGPMTGIENYNRKAFAQAATELTEKGYTILTTASLPQNLPDNKYMPICTAMIDAAEALYMLEGWGKSNGAVAEYFYAKRQNKKIFYQGEL